MAFVTINAVRIAGMSAFVPSKIESNYELNIIAPEERIKYVTSVGIENRRVSPVEYAGPNGQDHYRNRIRWNCLSPKNWTLLKLENQPDRLVGPHARDANSAGVLYPRELWGRNSL